MKKLGWWFWGALCLGGCARPDLPDKDQVQPAAAEPAPEVPAEAEPALPPSTLPVDIATPAEGELLAGGADVMVKFAAPAAGSPVWVQLDLDDPHVVADAAVVVKFTGLLPGPHVLRAAVVGDDGLSLAADGLQARCFIVGSGEPRPAGFDPTAALLSVARPAGTVALADTGEVPFDVRLDGFKLSGGAKLHWQVDGGEAEWLAEYPPAEPLSLGRLEPGRHTLKVWLTDAAGKPVENGGYARVEREFTVPEAGGEG